MLTSCGEVQEKNIQSDKPLTLDYDIQTINQYRGYGNGDENGFYFCDINKNAYINIKYIDYKTAQEVYLCSRPECEHKSDSCVSYIQPNGNTVTPYILQDKLCILYSGAGQGYFDVYGKQALPHIDVMDFNGENRKTVIELGINDRIIGNVAFDKNILYCVKQNIEMIEQNMIITNYLMGIDLITGQVVKEMEIDLKSPEFYGSNKDKIYIKEAKPGKTFSEGTVEIWEFSMADGKGNLDLTWSLQENSGHAYKDSIYLIDEKGNAIFKYDFQNKGITEIGKLDNVEAQNLTIEHITDNGIALCYKTKEREYNPIFFDFETQKSYKIELPLASDNKQFSGIPDIMGETKDNFLVAIDSYYEDVGFITPQGDKTVFSMWKYDLALIIKEDYINSNEKYIKISKQI